MQVDSFEQTQSAAESYPVPRLGQLVSMVRVNGHDSGCLVRPSPSQLWVHGSAFAITTLRAGFGLSSPLYALTWRPVGRVTVVDGSVDS